MGYKFKINMCFVLATINLVLAFFIAGTGVGMAFGAIQIGAYKEVFIFWLLMCLSWAPIKMAEININKVSPLLDEWEDQLNKELSEL